MPAETVMPDVFSAREIARAAGVPVWEARALIDAGSVKGHRGFVAAREAARAVRLLRGTAAPADRELFRSPAAARRSPGRALAASGALHAAMLAGLVFITTMGLAGAPSAPVPLSTPLRVFLAIPGPGGGGGGGGLRQPAPPPRAELKRKSALKSPVPPPRPAKKLNPEPRRVPPPPPIRPRPVERPVEPPPQPQVMPAPLPRVVAPVPTAAADPQDRPGVLAESPSDADSNGPGAGGGAGTGRGAGIGEGSGPGIGAGTGGGTGGGPYRQGSGITAPSLLREVKPEFTEEARRRGVEGDVVLEIVVRADGSVTGIKVLQGLGAGLDQRAAEAVRQWRFAPARRQGQAVDVVVEVAVEFKLR